MINKNWFAYWDENYTKFEWFFEKYGFTKEWNSLLIYRDKEHRGAMLTIMNRVWFELPSNIFNIKNMPKGWDEFLYLLESD